MKHNLYKTGDSMSETIARWVFEGGLAICKVCGGAEGSLPTACPGRKMTSVEQDSVYAGKIDFTNGQWVAKTKGDTP